MFRLIAWSLGACAVAGAFALLVAPDPSYRFQSWMALGRYSSHDARLLSIGRETGVEPALLKALAWKSSAFQSAAVSDSGARGLFLVDATTARAWAAAHRIETFMPSDLADPETNTRVAAWALARSFDQWKHTDAPETFVLATFGMASRAALVPPAQSSSEMLATLPVDRRQWVESILQRRNFYKSRGW